MLRSAVFCMLLVSQPVVLAADPVPAPVTAPAPVATTFEVPGVSEPDVPVGELVKALMAARKSGDSGALAASILMIAIFILRKLFAGALSEGRTDLLPWITLAGAVCGGVLLGIQAHLPIGECVWSGVLIGLAASGAWSLVGKHLVKLWPPLKNLAANLTAKPPQPPPAQPPAPPDEKKPA